MERLTISPARIISTSRSLKAVCISASWALASRLIDWRIPSALSLVVQIHRWNPHLSHPFAVSRSHYRRSSPPTVTSGSIRVRPRLHRHATYPRLPGLLGQSTLEPPIRLIDPSLSETQPHLVLAHPHLRPHSPRAFSTLRKSRRADLAIHQARVIQERTRRALHHLPFAFYLRHARRRRSARWDGVVRHSAQGTFRLCRGIHEPAHSTCPARNTGC